MTDTYVRLVSLPTRVEGVTLPNDDGSFDIYINSRLSPALNVVLHPPAGMVPCFHSEAALAHWVDTLCGQLGVEL